MTEYNLAKLPQEEKDRINVDMAAASVAFKERYNMPVIAEMVRNEQPEHLREYFMERVAHHRATSRGLGKLDIVPKEPK